MNKVYAKFLNTGGHEFQRKKAAEIFDTEKEYRITGGSIGDSYSYFTFEGIEGTFNTVMFDTPWEEAQHLMEHNYRVYDNDLR
jgi:hypothetical protein